MPRIIGITGNIACGKTAVGHILLELGAERYIDADALVHELYQSGKPIAVKVAETFGPAVVAPDGSIDRKALGAIVFQDAEAMQRLESIVHPAVSRAVANEQRYARVYGWWCVQRSRNSRAWWHGAI